MHFTHTQTFSTTSLVNQSSQEFSKCVCMCSRSLHCEKLWKSAIHTANSSLPLGLFLSIILLLPTLPLLLLWISTLDFTSKSHSSFHHHHHQHVHRTSKKFRTGAIPLLPLPQQFKSPCPFFLLSFLDPTNSYHFLFQSCSSSASILIPTPAENPVCHLCFPLSFFNRIVTIPLNFSGNFHIKSNQRRRRRQVSNNVTIKFPYTFNHHCNNNTQKYMESQK